MLLASFLQHKLPPPATSRRSRSSNAPLCPPPSLFRHAQPQPSPPLSSSSSSSAVSATSASAGYLVSPEKQHVQPARPGEVQPLQLGNNLTLDVPLLAAPMAGITAAPLRLMYTQAGARLAVSEMLIAHTLQSGSKASQHLARFSEQELNRSVQLYGVTPQSIDWACRHLVQEAGVSHIDLNFGCPVRKVTSRGGGSALPLRPQLFRRLVAAAVAAAEPYNVPVTVKLRMGLTPQLLTHIQAGQIAAAEGVSGIVLHARTACQQYDPPAHWSAIAALVESLPPNVPVVGNGDVCEAADAVEMIRQTGCRGVMIGRPALGRPWLFTEAADMLCGRLPTTPPPPLGGVLALALQHLTAWAEWEQDEMSAVLKMRKLIPCYLSAFKTPKQGLQQQLFAAKTLADWHKTLEQGLYDPTEPYPVAALRRARLKGGSGPGSRKASQKVVLPQGWLDDTGASFDDAWMQQEGLQVEACEG